MTVIDTIRDFILSRIGLLDMVVVRFCVQAALVVVCPTVACGMAYIKNIRIVPVQLALCAISWITLLCIPVDRLEIYNAWARVWLLTVCTLTVLFVTPCLGFLLAPSPNGSRRATQSIYLALFILLVWQLTAEELKR